MDSSADGAGPAFSFVNGLEVVGRGKSAKVLVTYGSGDSESRMLVLGVRELDREFFYACSNLE